MAAANGTFANYTVTGNKWELPCIYTDMSLARSPSLA
jgi:hypothetical protein